MRIIQGTTDIRADTDRRLAVAIGKFDGVHLGHTRLLKILMDQKADDLVPSVFTFDPDPMSLFTGRTIPQLTTREEKRKLFEAAGVELLIEFPMTAETAAISPEDFVREYLVGRLHAGFVAAGTDLSFGYKGRGDLRLLKAMGNSLGFEVCSIDKVIMNRREISSTYIREELMAGHIEMAGRLLGRPYGITGEIVRCISCSEPSGGMTILIRVPHDKLLPPDGIYEAEIRVPDEFIHGRMMISHKSILSENDPVIVEIRTDKAGVLCGRRSGEAGIYICAPCA